MLAKPRNSVKLACPHAVTPAGGAEGWIRRLPSLHLAELYRTEIRRYKSMSHSKQGVGTQDVRCGTHSIQDGQALMDYHVPQQPG